jgi:phosphatidate cytidylyltransferase
MINNELEKRIVTSMFLFLSSLFLILINELIFIFSIFAISVICFHEWNDINKPFFFNKKKRVMLIIRLSGFVYIFIFFISSLFVYKIMGDIFFIYVIIVCSSSDIGGFVFGKIIGGKKLTRISPNKTISGTVGSFFFSLIALIIFNSQTYFDFDYSLTFKNISFCLIISLSNQLGDLIISYFKRLNKVKNTGDLLPGHGGLLDRIDGIILALPVSTILIIIMF